MRKFLILIIMILSIITLNIFAASTYKINISEGKQYNLVTGKLEDNIFWSTSYLTTIKGDIIINLNAIDNIQVIQFWGRNAKYLGYYAKTSGYFERTIEESPKNLGLISDITEDQLDDTYKIVPPEASIYFTIASKTKNLNNALINGIPTSWINIEVPSPIAIPQLWNSDFSSYTLAGSNYVFDGWDTDNIIGSISPSKHFTPIDEGISSLSQDLSGFTPSAELYYRYDYKIDIPSIYNVEPNISMSDGTRNTSSNNIYNINLMKKDYSELVMNYQYLNNLHQYTLGVDTDISNYYNVNGVPITSTSKYKLINQPRVPLDTDIYTLPDGVKNKLEIVNGEEVWNKYVEYFSPSSPIFEDDYPHFIAEWSLDLLLKDTYLPTYNFSQHGILNGTYLSWDTLVPLVTDYNTLSSGSGDYIAFYYNTMYLKIRGATLIQLGYSDSLYDFQRLVNSLSWQIIGQTSVPVPNPSGSTILTSPEPLDHIYLYTKLDTPITLRLTDLTSGTNLPINFSSNYSTYRNISKKTGVLEYGLELLATGITPSFDIINPTAYYSSDLYTYIADNGNNFSSLSKLQQINQMESWIGRAFEYVQFMKLTGLPYPKVIALNETIAENSHIPTISIANFKNTTLVYSGEDISVHEPFTNKIDNFFYKIGVFNESNITIVKIFLSVLIILAAVIILAILKAPTSLVIIGGILVFALFAAMRWIPIWLVLVVSIVMILIVFLKIRRTGGVVA